MIGTGSVLLSGRVSKSLERAIPIALGALSLSWALLRTARWLLGMEPDREED